VRSVGVVFALLGNRAVTLRDSRCILGSRVDLDRFVRKLEIERLQDARDQLERVLVGG
jgi:hypothetical protein